MALFYVTGAHKQTFRRIHETPMCLLNHAAFRSVPHKLLLPSTSPKQIPCTKKYASPYWMVVIINPQTCVHWQICGLFDCTRKIRGHSVKEISTQAWLAFQNVWNGRHLKKKCLGWFLVGKKKSNMNIETL